ncbi:LysR family transcriptional regulator [Enterococcus sp. 5H]|uniref:LysR family transcriptional regulator n=1 Tax=Enterococcus sp. 5H TaxID=1229490 RepID=UPI00230482E5|nr:LysR family transcriptional regulator [Enterococcus sp. 5H]MDA9472528.1 putative LysR family transcriptional regulator [Enterococcus sp. 5H]
MDLRTLRYFITVAQEGTISKAANMLHLTQPTLSKQLMELEEELGVILFIRGNRKITLTEEGSYLVSQAKEILTLVEKTTSNLSKEEHISGDIHIGAGESHAMSFLAKIIHQLINNYPDVKIHLHSGNADELSEKLDNGLLDFVLVIEPVDKKKYNFIQLPAKDCWGLLVPSNSDLASKEYIMPQDLHEIPLLISRQSKTSSELENWFGKSLNELNIIGSYNLLFNASLLVNEQVAYALCLDKIITTDEHSPLCFRPLKPTLEAGLAVIWKNNQIQSKAAKKFLDILYSFITDK